MSVSQKTQYALRAILELALAHGEGPKKIGSIAQEQAIPPRFLEIILNELKQGGFVESRRGCTGGYFLTHRPEKVSVGDVIRYLDGPLDPVSCIDDPDSATCRTHNRCVLVPMFRKVRDAVSDIYDNTTFADLAAEKKARDEHFVLDFAI